MSYDEKNTWIYFVLAVTIPVIYFATILGQLGQTAASEIFYQGPLLAAIGAAIVLAIVATIVIAIAAPKEAGVSDQRDKDINRLGEYVGGSVLGVGMLVPFILAMLEFDQFWIANTIYLAFVVGAVTGTTVKLVAYRRGF
jgi:hypothetical protein